MQNEHIHFAIYKPWGCPWPHISLLMYLISVCSSLIPGLLPRKPGREPGYKAMSVVCNKQVVRPFLLPLKWFSCYYGNVSWEEPWTWVCLCGSFRSLLLLLCHNFPSGFSSDFCIWSLLLVNGPKQPKICWWDKLLSSFSSLALNPGFLLWVLSRSLEKIQDGKPRLNATSPLSLILTNPFHPSLVPRPGKTPT